MNMDELYDWIVDLPNYLDEKQSIISAEIIKEIKLRIGFLLDVGLNYLDLNRSARTLSGESPKESGLLLRLEVS